jgi:hypothetical protein
MNGGANFRPFCPNIELLFDFFNNSLSSWNMIFSVLKFRQSIATNNPCEQMPSNSNHPYFLGMDKSKINKGF